MKRLSWGFAGGNGLLHGLVLGGGDTQWKLTRSPQAYPATTVGIQQRDRCRRGLHVGQEEVV